MAYCPDGGTLPLCQTFLGCLLTNFHRAPITAWRIAQSSQAGCAAYTRASLQWQHSPSAQAISGALHAAESSWTACEKQQCAGEQLQASGELQSTALQDACVAVPCLTQVLQWASALTAAQTVTLLTEPSAHQVRILRCLRVCRVCFICHALAGLQWL